MVLAVVVPFLDERAVLGEMLGAVAAQTRAADRLILVDDGSTDGSRELAERFAAEGDHVAVDVRPPRAAGRDRLAMASELAAFQQAVAALGDGWDVVAKLDADIRLPPRAFEELLERFAADPALGIAGSFLSEVPAAGGPPARIAIGDGHVHGATKFYRRACWEQIAPLPAILGWDTIDELRARRAGWGTASFALSEGDPLHLRARGSHDGVLRAHRRWGLCAYAFGEPAPLVLAESMRQLARRPRVIGGVSYGLGWLGGALRRAPRAEPELRAWVRRERYRRVARRLVGA
jgi:glycosyltransferase involved in cell wall biosynthesis